MQDKPGRKIQTSKQLNIWPAKHLSDAIRHEARKTGKTLTRLVEECLANRFDLPVDSQRFSEAISETKYPAHAPNSMALNDKGEV